jgi:hypothetical protein
MSSALKAVLKTVQAIFINLKLAVSIQFQILTLSFFNPIFIVCQKINCQNDLI